MVSLFCLSNTKIFPETIFTCNNWCFGNFVRNLFCQYKWCLLEADRPLYSIFSFLPPSTTIRRYLRTTYSTTASQLGQSYCDIVSSMTSHGGPEPESIVRDLVAIRLKLKKTMALRANAAYEVCAQLTRRDTY